MVTPPALVEARAVAYAYSSRAAPRGADAPPAVDGIDLAIAPGALVCLLGPNGSGKSTLLKLLGGLLRPARGEVRLAGAPIDAMAPRERARRVALVPQYLPTLADVHVTDFVAAGRYAHLGFWRDHTARDRDAVRRALSEADAADLGDRLLTELSGGQRQRVLVARALAQEADLLLFDEPTASLDPDHQVRTFALIAELLARPAGGSAGRAAVVATHELSLASRFATHAVLMDAGTVRAAGAPAEILTRAVLEPVYGPHLWFGAAGPGRPVVVPWLD
jgi:iron complex transport system ATP-binding protein